MWQVVAVRAAGTVPWGRIVAVVLAVPLLVLAVVTMAVLGTGVEVDAADQRGDCQVTVNRSGVGVAGLDEVQLSHAATIIEVGQSRGLPVQAVRVALAVAAQESTFRNYANDGTGQLRADQGAVAASLAYPHDAVGRDHGSVNVFQQQYPWWGSLPELMDPPTAAGKFYDALVEVPGWEVLPLTTAAQRVQRSAFPNAYARWEPLADELLAALTAPAVAGSVPGTSAEASVGTGVSADASVAPVAPVAPVAGYAEAAARCQDRAVPASFTALAGADAGERAVNVAASWIGTPYSWGGGTVSGPSEGFAQGAGTVGFDCSGLLLHAWYQGGGVRLPHSSVAIAALGTVVPVSEARAGDVLSFATSGGTRISHDGMYDGRGGMVHAPRTGKTVEYVADVFTDDYYGSRLVSVTRPAAGGAAVAQPPVG